MNLVKRLRNLFILSSLELGEAEKLILTKKDDKLVVMHEEKPKMAQIIKLKSPVEQALE